ncbi:hypothetical protein MMC26_005926 [Xylographa opegraphella]|nr:hypothetical protein [Xylographa opegraphella]
MHLSKSILVIVGACYALSRNFVVAVAGNCVGCARPPQSTGASLYRVRVPGISLDPQTSPNSVFTAPIGYVGGNSRYSIFCGTQNTQVQTSLEDAVDLVAGFIERYFAPWHYQMRIIPFEPLSQIFPADGEFHHVLLPLNFFARAVSVRISVPGFGGTAARSIVCATPTMSADYGFTSSYYDICNQDPTMVAFHPAGTATLMLCPSFFNLPTRFQGNHCPTWNRFLQSFYHSYEPLTVEYQTYTLLRGFLGVGLGAQESIFVGPSPRVPNWNELIALPLEQKLNSPALYQLYVALLEQHCRLSPPPPQNDFNNYIWSLARFYLGKLNTETDTAVRGVVEEMINNIAGPSTDEVGESSSSPAS